MRVVHGLILITLLYGCGGHRDLELEIEASPQGEAPSQNVERGPSGSPSQSSIEELKPSTEPSEAAMEEEEPAVNGDVVECSCEGERDD